MTLPLEVASGFLSNPASWPISTASRRRSKPSAASRTKRKEIEAMIAAILAKAFRGEL